MQIFIRISLSIILGSIALLCVVFWIAMGTDILTAYSAKRHLAGTTCQSYLNTIRNGSETDKAAFIKSFQQVGDSAMILVDKELSEAPVQQMRTLEYCLKSPSEPLRNAVLGYNTQRGPATLTKMLLHIEEPPLVPQSPDTGIDITTPTPVSKASQNVSLTEKLTQEVEAYKQALQSTSPTVPTKTK